MIRDYEHIIIKECGEPLVNLKAYGFVLEPMYFKNNIADRTAMYLRESAAKKLLEVQKSLGDHKIKIWDGWRDYKTQKILYDTLHDKLKKLNPTWNDEQLKDRTLTFVSDPYNPKKIPLHLTGGAVDLTLVDQDGQELNMGGEFDHFSDEDAALYYENHPELDQKIRANRKLLREAMVTGGFRFDQYEWWHFDYGNQIWALERQKPFAIYGLAEIK
ncbi:MAG: M15 family metallopeptidase [Patescibacteria group bacterium]|nr:M15 family metallopeptidase [Patescibacteria group bacterium]